MDCARPPSVDIGVVATKGGDFELESVLEHDDDAELRAYRVGAREDLLDCLGPRIGCDIDVFGGLAADQITHATAREIRDRAVVAQSRDYFPRRRFHRRLLFLRWSHPDANCSGSLFIAP